jgi:tRNA uridine 5-carbamoylmethylation protein Kti12
MAKKISLSKKQMNDLQGFEEIVDLVTGEKTELIQPRRNDNEDYELFNYLEKEIKRLEKIDHYFRHSLEVVNRHSQTKALLDHELTDLDRVKQAFINEVTSDKSQFLANMDAMFTSVFRI